jgi:hypothetical protein
MATLKKCEIWMVTMTMTMRRQMWTSLIKVVACVLATAGLQPTNAVAQTVSSPDTGPPAAHGAFPSAAFDGTGRLWVTWIDGHQVMVASSTDQGRTYGRPTRVTTEPEEIDATGDARPKVAIGSAGEIYVAWTRRGRRPFTGDIRFVRSVDAGRSFSTPQTINDDGLQVGHRFESLGINERGELFMVWIDKRDLEAALADDEPYAGAALYYTWSTDGGASFAPNRKIKDHVCECCRIALTFDEDGWPVVVWREVLDGGVRDHGIVRFLDRDRFTEIGRVAVDNWQIDGCPHHGPALTRDGDGAYHAVWLTGAGPRGPGAFYARTTDAALTFTEPMRIGTRTTLGHADIEALDRHVVIVWKERVDPDATAVHLTESKDAGRTWSETREVTRTTGISDHPLLVTDEGTVLLTWHTEHEGYQVIPLHTAPATN